MYSFSLKINAPLLITQYVVSVGFVGFKPSKPTKTTLYAHIFHNSKLTINKPLRKSSARVADWIYYFSHYEQLSQRHKSPNTAFNAVFFATLLPNARVNSTGILDAQKNRGSEGRSTNLRCLSRSTSRTRASGRPC